jgi:hypothetical protein
MIKKFVSNALLSVFMDKKARDTLHQSRNPKAATDPVTDPDQASSSDLDDLENQMVGGDPVDNMNKDEVAALIRDSLDHAEREIMDRKAKHAANPGRQALIDQAMAIHRSKRHIVDELPDDQREKLMFMALKTLGNPDDPGGKR